MAGNPTSDFVDHRLFEVEPDEVLKPPYIRPNDPDDDERDEDEEEILYPFEFDSVQLELYTYETSGC